MSARISMIDPSNIIYGIGDKAVFWKLNEKRISNGYDLAIQRLGVNVPSNEFKGVNQEYQTSLQNYRTHLHNAGAILAVEPRIIRGYVDNLDKLVATLSSCVGITFRTLQDENPQYYSMIHGLTKKSEVRIFWESHLDRIYEGFRFADNSFDNRYGNRESFENSCRQFHSKFVKYKQIVGAALKDSTPETPSTVLKFIITLDNSVKLLSSMSGTDFFGLEDEYKSLVEEQRIYWTVNRDSFKATFESAAANWEQEALHSSQKWKDEIYYFTRLKDEFNTAYTGHETTIVNTLAQARNEYQGWTIISNAIKHLRELVTGFSAFTRTRFRSEPK